MKGTPFIPPTPDRRDKLSLASWLYERAEEAVARGLTKAEALSTVADGAESIYADRDFAIDEQGRDPYPHLNRWAAFTDAELRAIGASLFVMRVSVTQASGKDAHEPAPTLRSEIDVELAHRSERKLRDADPTRYATPDRPASTDAGAGNLP